MTHRKTRGLPHLALALWLGLVGSLLPARAAEQVINRGTVHLRSGSQPEWDEFAHRTPDGTNLVLRFVGATNLSEATLLIAQDNVKLDWPVQLNGKKLGTLFLMEAPLIHTLVVPPGTLRDGDNVLSILPPKENDDILIGEIRLYARSKSEAISQARMEVEVNDSESGVRLPCRITLVDDKGRLAPCLAPTSAKLAVRPGVIYTADGQTTVGLGPGTYTVYATRGFEYGLARKEISVTRGETTHVRLSLKREVPTAGLICTDTHIHTGTFARHGDATVEERLVTLAGEGIEMPISTEHDCLVDFTGAAERSGVQDWLTPVIGDEVTTLKEHFNIFPVNPQAQLPDKKISDRPQLMDAFRAIPGVQVIVLNHPRNIHNNFQPFASTNFNAVTGRNLRGFEFTFDAIEVANSSALQSDWMLNFYDWFALLNYGYRFTAIGSSDGHDVSRYIVGQGRTYIACDDTHPSHIDINQACRNLKQGRALVSLGLLVNMSVNGAFGVGDLATGLGERMRVVITILGPSWVTADRVELFANGQRIREVNLSSATLHRNAGEPLKVEVPWDIPRPKHDVYLVAIASGPGVLEPYWSLARPYQPTSTHWDPRVVGATNPIWVDADGDGQFSSARGYAQQLMREHGSHAPELVAALASYDQAVAAEAAGLWQEQGMDLRSPALGQALAQASEHVRKGFEAVLNASGR